MAKVSFYRGSYASYQPSGKHANAVYFATDKKTIYMNGNAYAGEDAATAIADITLSADGYSINIEKTDGTSSSLALDTIKTAIEGLDTKAKNIIKTIGVYSNNPEQVTLSAAYEGSEYEHVVKITSSVYTEEVASAAGNGLAVASDVKSYVDEAVAAAETAGAVTVEDASSPTEGYLKTYVIKQNTEEVGRIDIPKDLVVTSGSIVNGTWSGNKFTESASGTGKALKLIIANQTAPVYINVADLCDAYTAGNGIEISSTNVVSAKRDASSEDFLTISANGIKVSGVQDAIDNALAWYEEA